MRFSTAITLAAAATASAAASVKRSSPLEVTLSAEGHNVTALIKNTGSFNLNLLSLGTLLDTKDPVEKVQITKGAKPAPFSGMKIHPAFNALVPSSFTLLKSGESFEVSIDPSELHDLTEGGDFDIQASGQIHLADENSTTLNGKSVSYSSNLLSIPIDTIYARSARDAYLSKRATISDDCQGTELDLVREALTAAISMSNGAVSAARDGDEGKFAEYFKDTSGGARQVVASRFSAIARAASAFVEGPPMLSCVDNYPTLPCQNGAGAYAIDGLVVWCPFFFYEIPTVTDTCHAQDRANYVIHEFSHVEEVYSPLTSDFAYGYDESVALPAEQAILNADTFALYANAIEVGC